jgi:hypothetical protein
MAQFFARLTTKRPDFPADMSQEEGAAMAELLARDPANAIGSYDVSPMGSAVARPASGTR